MNWEEDKEIINQTYFESINQCNIECFGLIKENFEKVRKVFPLIEFILERVETMTTLILDNRLWDAEIVNRSALETLVKFLFIITAGEQEKEKRLTEFWESLAEINSLKQSMQTTRNLKYFGESEIHRVAFSPLILPESLEVSLREKWTKAERLKLEQKWSFTEMLLSISKTFHGKPFETLIALSHSYRMGSHVLHGDETGILIIKERNSRSHNEKLIAERGHYLRLLSDCFAYCILIAVEISEYLNLKEKTDEFIEIRNKVDSISDLISKYSGKVFEDPDYAKYKSRT